MKPNYSSNKRSDDTLRLEAIIQTATDGIIIIDRFGNMELVNDSAAKLFGYGKRELIGKNVSLLMPEPHHSNHDGYINNYLRTGIKKIIGIGRDVTGKKKDGTLFPFRLSISEVKLADRIIFTGIVYDMTERKKAEQALRDEKEKAQLYFDIANTLNVVINQEGKVLEISNNGCKLIGLPETQILSQDLFQLLFPKDKSDKVREIILQMIDNKIEFMPYFEAQVIDNHGHLRYYSWHNNLIKDKSGQNNGMILSGIDITERKVVERALKHEKEKAQQYLDVANTIIVVINEQEEIVLLNKKGYELLGYPEGSLEYKNWFDVTIKEDERDFMRSFFHKALTDKSIQEYFENSIVTQDGQHRLMAWRNAPVFDDQGALIATISSGVDITDQRAAEEKLISLNTDLEHRVDERTEELAEAVNQLLNINKKLEHEIQERQATADMLRAREQELRAAYEKEKELSELKSRFVSMASHEFRTPLSTILSSADLIEAYKKQEQQNKRERHTSRIKSSVANLTGILNDFLSLSKLEEGKISINPVEFDIYAVINDVLDQMNSHLKPQQVIRHEIHVDPPMVVLDKKLLQNVFINLISNAIKYSGPNTTIDFQIKKEKENLIVIIADQGIGIPEEEQQHLFTRFFRARNVENIQGTGLGLNIVKRHVELMKGSIAFESKVGKGTTFTIFIPIGNPNHKQL
ncbi:MAG: PAS domain S-box protein [Bacteroidota bacterium]